MEEKLPPGFRFHPTDEELITYYLTRKVSDFGFTSKAIADVDLNKCEPWDLPAKASMGVKEWYFFSLKDRKYPTGLRTNRATEAGYWKTTGKDKEIFRGNLLVGMKKTLVFYRGRAPKGEKTNWVMHEYRLETKLSCKSTKEEWVVCRVFQKTATIKKPQPASSPQPSLDSADVTNTNTNEFGDNELPNLNSLSCSSDVAFSNLNPSTLQDCYDMGIGNNLNAANCSSNLNMNVGNWARELTANTALPSLPWPPNLLSPPNLSTVNSLLLKALQIKTNMYPPREASNSDIYSFMPQGAVSSQYGAGFSSNYPILPTSNKVADALPQQSHHQQQQQQRQELQKQEEQPFNLDSMW